MRRTLAITLITLLGGCAMTAPELKERGNLQTLNSALPPAAAARCIIQKSPEAWGGTMGHTRDAKPGSAEVALYYGGLLAAIVEITPAAGGSRMDARLLPSLISLEENRVLGGVKAC